MLFHNVKYNLKALFKNKGLIFWSFAFPIIMATLFNMAFGNWEESEKFTSINIGIVTNEYFDNNIIAKNVFNSLSDGDNKIFNITYASKDEVTNLLTDKKIEGIIEYTNSNPSIIINSNSVSSTIIKSVVDEIETNNTIFSDLMKSGKYTSNDMEEQVNRIIEKINSTTINTKDISVKKLDIAVIEYYSLLAMTCLYGGFIAMSAISNSLASASNRGKRVAISPIKKSMAILSSLCASFIVQLIGALLLLIYINIIGVNLHTNLISLFIITILGVLAGISIGLIVSVMINKSEDTKLGIIIAISMALSVLSGMTGVSLKYVIDSKIPFINEINPAAMITDGLYAVYYENSARFLNNIISLIIFISLLIVISILYMRRKKYDNI